MKIQILNDLYNEVNRLFIAGAKFAKNDLRIGKLLPALQKMGEKSPAMKRLADLTDNLSNTDEPEEALLDLGVLLNAMLNTQGDTTSAEISSITETKVAFFSELPRTTAPYSTLEPVINALTIIGPGRLEPVKSAHENGELNDFRLYALLSAGLPDRHSELSDYLYETAIPALGSVMIPFLTDDLDITSNHRAQAQRFALLDSLGYENSLELANKAVNEGSPTVQIAAIKVLGRNTQNEELLLKLADDRKTEIREAAFIGLVRMDSKAGKEKMITALGSSKFKSATEAAKICTDPEYTLKIFECVKKVYEEKIIVKGATYGDCENFVPLFATLINKEAEYILDFFIRVFCDFDKKSRKNSPVKGYISNAACRLLYNYKNKNAALSTYERICAECSLKGLDGLYVSNYFEIASAFYDPKKMFDTFSHYYASAVLFFEYLDLSKLTNLDSRWVDEFIKKRDFNQLEFCLSKDIEREKIQDFLKTVANERGLWDNDSKAYEYIRVLRLLVKNLLIEELNPVAENFCAKITGLKHLNSWVARDLTSFFRYEEVALKLFNGSRHFLEAIKDFCYEKRGRKASDHHYLYDVVDNLLAKSAIEVL